MNKTAIKNFAVWARRKLITDIQYKSGMLGITEYGIAEALPQSTNDLKFFDVGTKNYTEIAGNEIKQRDALVAAIKAKEKSSKNYKEAFEYIVEEVAYTWFNRLIAIRFMEVNDYLPSGIRVLSSENTLKNEPDFVTNPFDTDLEFTPYEQDRVIQLKDENKLDELFRMLFIKQCNKLHEILPNLFEETEDYTELLLTISFTDTDGVVSHLVHDISEDDFNVKKEGQIEIIGWMYQFYNIEPKAEVFAKNEKISKEKIPAATQLFTPDWIVRYMVENSLGRLWLDGHSESSIKSNWKYFLEEAKQESEIELEKIKSEHKKIKPNEIKLIDPCMGSGHILVYAFDVFVQIYEAYGYTQRDAVTSIVENNIFGFDIDNRAYQLAYFAIMMKARQYDRRFLSKGIKLNLYAIQESNSINASHLDLFEECKPLAEKLLRDFVDAKEYGSIISPKININELEILEEKYQTIVNTNYDSLFDSVKQIGLKDMFEPILQQAKILVQKYDITITNPPYMNPLAGSSKLSDYVRTNFPDSKADLYAVFIEKNKQMLRKYGYLAMITMHSWMFLASFEMLRNKIINTQDIISMCHLGARAFEEISGEVVQTTAFVFRNSSTPKYISVYKRLVKAGSETAKEKAFLESKDTYYSNSQKYSSVPGQPIAYWWSDSVFNCFEEQKYINGNPMKGIQTGKGEKYLRYWFEVNNAKTGFSLKSHKEMCDSKLKWFPLTSGGLSRKWYGNYEMVVNLENDGFDIRSTGLKNFRLKDPKYYFLEGLTWTEVTTKPFTCRYLPNTVLFGNGGPVAFFNNDKLFYTIGLLNSVVTKELFSVLAPTMNYGPDQVRNIPLKCENEASVEELVKQNINLSKEDWDSFETSWDFKTHPLVRLSETLWDANSVAASMSFYYGEYPNVSCPLELAFLLWQGECKERFNQIKSNEEELNRIFIEIYGLQDVLTTTVEEKDVTVRQADLQREIKSLISYAVGCMFGRYSLDTEGLIYAGSNWNLNNYSLFNPDKDNCIPITDEDYFEDDIVGRFINFIKKIFGKDSLELNLDYIAKALGNKGTTSREVIRNYFVSDFIKDHIKIYQKKPIYWLFDSGKENGFKALVYMHRWCSDTTGNMRVEYLHRMQRVYEKEIERMQEIIDNSNDNKEISYANKRKEKLQKQLKETKDYDALVAHLALSRIDIDLDDGVKVNYEKVQTSADGKKMQIMTKF